MLYSDGRILSADVQYDEAKVGIHEPTKLGKHCRLLKPASDGEDLAVDEGLVNIAPSLPVRVSWQVLDPLGCMCESLQQCRFNLQNLRLLLLRKLGRQSQVI